jgi:integrase
MLESREDGQSITSKPARAPVRSLAGTEGEPCRGIPVFSPHDLRHRRISLLHQQGRSWAEIALFVGQRKLSITADTFTHVLIDGGELDCAPLLA